MSAELEPGIVVEGRYIVEARVGVGGMAAVYRVRHAQLDTTHALKVLTVSGASLQRRLMQEGRVQAALRHPNIVSVTDVVDVDGSPGLVMEYVRGPSLETLLEHKRLDVADQVDALAIGILDGVIAAHALGLIHRDLKPANVMLAVTQDGLVPKVADFGLVKLVAGDDPASFSRTRSGVTMGTPAYMAPEQIRDSKGVDHRADVWSLGALLYEVVAGEQPFQADDLIKLFVEVAEGRRRPIRETGPVPERWARAIEGALVPEREQRIGDVRALREVWLDDVRLPARSPWDADTLALAASLGAGGDDPRAFLERSFRSNAALRKPPPAEATDLRVDGPTAVPPSLAGPQTVDAPRNETFALDDEPDVAEPPAPAPPAAARPVWPVAAVGLGSLALGIATVAAWVAFGPEPTPEPVPPEPVPALVAPVPAPAPEVVPEPAPEPVSPAPVGDARPAPPEPAPTATPAPSPAPDREPAPAPDPEPVVAVVEPAPVAVAPPRISLERDAADISIVIADAAGVAVSPGDVAPGAYTVRVFWDGATRDPTGYGPFDLHDGSALIVSCYARRHACTTRLTP